MQKLTRISFCLMLGAISTTAVWSSATGKAHAKPCPGVGHAGYLDFRDWEPEPDRCAWVEGTNADWAAFAGSWNNQADSFVNNGRTHNVCVYDGTSRSGAFRFMTRGATLIWRNVVSSNWWTQGQGC